MMPDGCAQALMDTARRLRDRVSVMCFALPVTHTYNPLDYAWDMHAAYLGRYGGGQRRVIFLGMNPGPFGMAQTGVPFGEIAAVRDWLGLAGHIGKPAQENPARPVSGFSCPRSEVSGRRLWGLFRDRFGMPEAFFAGHFVANYCPLAFFAGTRNVTPDKLPAQEQSALLAACDCHLREMVAILMPDWLIGVGSWAETRARAALVENMDFRAGRLRIGRILHPSPASPAANRGWAEAATRQLAEQGVW
jgi:single-strand selective monofunctional uracil DNA glycosylase